MWMTMAENSETTERTSRQPRLKRRSRKSGNVATFERKYSGAKNSESKISVKPAIHSKLPNTRPNL